MGTTKQQATTSDEGTTAGGAYVLGLQEVEGAHVALVGGKAASLGALMRIGGVAVPDGFVVTTAAFRAAAAAGGTLPDDVAAAIVAAVTRLGADGAYAVRSSATAEDGELASFAGQHDSFLDVTGVDAVLEHVGRVFASLRAERAVAYRQRAGVDEDGALMAVVVQRMVPADAAGVLFTADPISGNRRVTAIEAVRGLGEALVSGRSAADGFSVRDGVVETRTTVGDEPVLSDDELVRLEQLGRRIEAAFGAPQDIEWALADGELHVVQSRPITTLFPVPSPEAEGVHVYLSTGHQQMMTDAMKPLGLSLFQLTAFPVMHVAGSRLFVDTAERLAAPATRDPLLHMVGTSDPLTGDALRTLIARDGFLPPAPEEDVPAPTRGMGVLEPLDPDPAIVARLIAQTEAGVADLEARLADVSGPAAIDAVLADIPELKRILFDPESHQAIMSGMDAAVWLTDHLGEWLGERDATDVLSQSVPGNVTSEMGLGLLDVADVVRARPEVVAFLEAAGDDDGYLDALAAVPGGADARDAIVAYLDRYGMRCIGEIDITRWRWSERPALLVPMILANVRNFGPGEGPRRFARGLREAEAKERDVLARLHALEDGDVKAAAAKERIDLVRTFAGFREYPKYGIVCRYRLYKRALMAEAARLVEAGVLAEAEDAFFLSLPELREVAHTHAVDRELIADRRRAFAADERLVPPRVITSEGEVLGGEYRRDDLPPGALAGLAVSRGTVEGRARVILDVSGADVEPGDILVTAYTDPSWSPLFVAIGGLVTEVGGLMSHGAVIAREYGLPAVVALPNATRLIEDGQRIRVHGTDGYVEVLDAGGAP